MTLTPIEFLNGAFSLIIVLIFIVVGVLTILKYRKVKSKNFIWWGIGLLGQGLVWLGSGASFLLIVTTGRGLSIDVYVFLSFSWAAITLLFWMWTLTDLLFKEKQKIIMAIYIISSVLFETYFLYILFTKPEIHGTLSNPPIDGTFRGLLQLYLIFVLASIAISLFLFIRQSWKSESPEVKLKANILLIAMIAFVFGGILDGFVSLTTAPVFIVRIVLVISAVLFYLGWNLPEPVKKLFLKK